VISGAFAEPSYDDGLRRSAAAAAAAGEEAARLRAAAEAAAAETGALQKAAEEAAAEEAEAVRLSAAAEEAAAEAEARLKAAEESAAEAGARLKAAGELAAEAEARQRAAFTAEEEAAARRQTAEAVAAEAEARQRAAAELAAAKQAAAEAEAGRQAAGALAAAARQAATEAGARRKAAEEAAVRQKAAEESAAAAQKTVAEAEARLKAAETLAAAQRADEEAAAASDRSRADPGKGFSFKIDIDTNLAKFTHTDYQNDEYIGDAPVQDDNIWAVAANPNYDDTEISFGYDDPDGRYGAKAVFAFEELLKREVLLGDVYAWGKIGGVFGQKLGKYTDRIVAKVGGDKDLGVLIFGPSPSVKPNDLVIGTSDSLGLGSDVLGSLSSVYIGPVQAGVFFAPSEYHAAIQYTVGNSGTSQIAEKATVSSYYTYKAGANIKFTLPDIVTVGAAYRQAHLEGSTQTSTGTLQHDYGLYGIVYLVPTVTIGAGYSGRYLEDTDEEEEDIENYPFYHGFHLDASFRLGKFGLGLYNNLSFAKLAKDKTYSYVGAGNFNDDESMFVLYNQVEGSYDLTSALTLSLMARNYYGSLKAWKGKKGDDYGKDVFLVEAKATYKLSSHASLRGGIKFEKTVYGTPVASSILKNNNYSIALPIGLTLEW
jgi:hypothetical protein